MNDYHCEQCDRKITHGVAKFSLRRFGQELCIKDQKMERLKELPKKLAEFINKRI